MALDQLESVEMRWPSGANHDLLVTFPGAAPSVVEHPNPRPERGEVGALILAPVNWVHSLFSIERDRPQNALGGANGPAYGYSVREDIEVVERFDDGTPKRATSRIFLTLCAREGSWTWECHQAHWAPECWRPLSKRQEMYVGRWPD